MATNVCLAIIADSPSRLVVGTYPASWSLLHGSDQPNRAAGLIEAWDFDGSAGVLRVVPAAGPAAQERQIPLASLIDLSWGGLHETRFTEEHWHYELRLFFDDGRPGFLQLPGSAHFLCASADQARRMASRLRAFLKPLCSRLESSTLETLGDFWRNPAAGIKSIQERVGTRLAALDKLIPPPERPDSDHPELVEKPDPAAPARELLTQLQSALGWLGEAAADQQKNGVSRAAKSSGTSA
jgi:hypothetical protein